jgi:hypothetical protein
VWDRGNGILDGDIENLGRKVICGHIATYRYGITAGGSLDFVHDSLRLLFVEATFVSTMYGGHQHHSFTCKNGWGGSGKASYSLTTTFAPSLAKRRAALLPIPYASEPGGRRFFLAIDGLLWNQMVSFHTCAAPEERRDEDIGWSVWHMHRMKEKRSAGEVYL